MSKAVVKTGELSEEARRILIGLCEGGLKGELTAGPPDEPTARARIRFVRLDGDRLEADLPVADGEPVCLTRGDAVVLRFVWRDQVYQLRACVKQRLPSASDDPSSCDTLHFDKFGKLTRIQRRQTYRVSLLDLPPPLISFTRSDDSSVSATGSLIELSETGGRALVATAVMPFLRHSDTFRISFHLPDDPEPFVFLARRTRIISSEDDILVAVGLSWQLDGSWSEGRRVQARVSKFIAERQRKGRGLRKVAATH